ncbi:MAG: hypothetical protein ACAH17_00415 [Candidatus Paceibacterota bacterium]
MVTIWVLCGINNSLDIARRARLFAAGCAIIFLACLYSYLRLKYGW